MKTLIIYDLMYGNMKLVAEAIKPFSNSPQ